MEACSAMLRLSRLCSRALTYSRGSVASSTVHAAASGLRITTAPSSSSSSSRRYLGALCKSAAISRPSMLSFIAPSASYSTSSSVWHPTRNCPFSSGPPASGRLVVAASATTTATASAAPPDVAAVSAAAPASSVVSSTTLPAADLPSYSMRQVLKHTTDDSCWLLVDGKVYDVTSYLDDHPGGAESILLNTGVDASEEFNSIHSQEAKDLLQKFLIGTLKPTKKKAAAATTAEAILEESLPTAAPAQPLLLQLADPRTKYALPLVQKQQLNADTFFLRFGLAGPQTRLGLPCGKHVYLFADIGGETVARAYTPVSGDKDVGVLDLLIKVYWAGQHPAFPAGGKLTQHLAHMQVGDTIDVKGPMGKFQYEGHGAYQLNRQPGKARYLSMVAGGSGITPCYAVLRDVLSDPRDDTRCALIYANKQESDIWLRKELEELAATHPDRLHLWYTLEQPPTVAAAAAATAQEEGVAGAAAAASSGPAWRYSRGYITKDMMAQHLLPPGPDSLALMCGPPGMLEQAVVPGLKELGFAPEQMVVF